MGLAISPVFFIRNTVPTYNTVPNVVFRKHTEYISSPLTLKIGLNSFLFPIAMSKANGQNVAVVATLHSLHS